MKVTLELNAMRSQNYFGEFDKVVVDCACAGGIKIGRITTAENSDARKCGVDVILRDGSWLDGKR